MLFVFTVGNDPDKTSAFADNWQYAYFRFVFKINDRCLGGLALLGESAVRSILVFKLSVTQFLAVSNFVMYGFVGVAIVFLLLFIENTLRKKFKEIISNKTHG
ncbi:hypothetical protein GCM10020331_037760 [Ectobacillus funiculus]